MDRISFKYTLNPLSVKETEALINFRVYQAGYKSDKKLFLEEAISEVYNETKGYPRKIIMLCHKILKGMVMLDSKIADRILVQEVVRKDQQWRSATNSPAESMH